MTVKEYLNRPYILNEQIKEKMKKLESYKDLSCSFSSLGFEEKFSGTRNTDPPFVKYLGKIDELESEINADIDKLNDMKSTIDAQIDELKTFNEQLILRYRYLMFMSIPEIADKIGYTVRWTRKIHVDALQNFEKRHPTSPLVHP